MAVKHETHQLSGGGFLNLLIFESCQELLIGPSPEFCFGVPIMCTHVPAIVVVRDWRAIDIKF